MQMARNLGRKLTDDKVEDNKTICQRNAPLRWLSRHNSYTSEFSENMGR